VQKLIQYSLIKGKKRCIENSLLKISKNTQKYSNKNFNNIIKLAIILCTSIFKINSVKKNTFKKVNKKKTFSLIQKNKTRIFLGIKYLIKIVNNKKSDPFYKNFYKGLLLFLKNNNFIVEKNDLQGQVFLNKHFFFYYR